MKLQRLLFLVGLLALGALQRGYAQYVNWSRPLAPGIFNARSVTDAAGNTYVAGSYRGALTMGATTLPAPTGAAINASNAFVAKVSPQGLVQWALPGISALSDDVLALTLDPNGNVYAVFRGGVDSLGSGPTVGYGFALGSLTLPNGGTMLAKINTTGTALALSYLHQGATQAQVTALAADAAGSCLVAVGATGYGTPVFGPYTFPSSSSTYSTAVLRAAPGSSVALVRALVPTPGQFNTSNLRVADIEVGAAGNFYCAGQISGTAVLGTAPAVNLDSYVGSGGFVAQFSAAGVAQWGITSHNATGSGSHSAGNICLAVAPTGEVYVAGGVWASNVTFGNLPALPVGGFVLKLSASGTPLWARGAQTGINTDLSGGAVHLGLDAAGNVYRVGQFINNPVFGTTTLTSPVTAAYSPTFYLVSYDAAGALRWVRTADSQQVPNSSASHQGTGFGLDASGNAYLLNYSAFDLPTNTLRIDREVLGAGYTVLRLDPAGRLSGTLYIDQNGNGTRDAGEGPFAYPQVVSDATAGTHYSSTAGTGEYTVLGLPGAAYSISIPSPHAYYTVSAPATRTGTYPGAGQTTTGLDFGLAPNLSQADVRMTLTPVGVARPGFTVRYRLTLENRGTTTASGNANLVFDSRFSYVSSTPSGSRTGQTVTWAYTNLAPFAQLNYEVLLSLPTNAVMGTVLTSSATAPLTGDVTLDDNTASASQTVVTSYDPNDISVNYASLSPTQVAAGLPLDYVIRFQNMGTDTAFAVVITDTLDYARLNLSTIELISQSHNCLWSLTGRGLLTVRFPGIKLPHRNVDVIRSQGFLRFRVRPRPTLAVGDIVPNKADIFFDYNAPVRTNTATTTVMLTTAALASHTAAAWNAYPNPATDAVTIAADLTTAGPVRLDLLDALGRSVRREVFMAPAGPLRQTLDLRGLAPGFYVLRLTPPAGPASSQQLVRE
ncbi:T9SS type A sorting domain-containing protein [Hymenobacter monticola]|uniref:T9SS type A sorting domain-containing protein n=1 Tax=Hymenobacter monticola TaxID=1705399 RepID=A0ABY4BB18_9BACT|nr:T9SS type A sorting domain-containing protein [Hymenobacter monticola]UOE35186.1 T9SS type A sorting domain-containing protein [Hymenobacter monticola]